LLLAIVSFLWFTVLLVLLVCLLLLAAVLVLGTKSVELSVLLILWVDILAECNSDGG